MKHYNKGKEEEDKRLSSNAQEDKDKPPFDSHNNILIREDMNSVSKSDQNSNNKSTSIFRLLDRKRTGRQLWEIVRQRLSEIRKVPDVKRVMRGSETQAVVHFSYIIKQDSKRLFTMKMLRSVSIYVNFIVIPLMYPFLTPSLTFRIPSYSYQFILVVCDAYYFVETLLYFSLVSYRDTNGVEVLDPRKIFVHYLK